MSSVHSGMIRLAKPISNVELDTNYILQKKEKNQNTFEKCSVYHQNMVELDSFFYKSRGKYLF